MSDAPSPWWGRSPVALREAARFEIGPLRLLAERRPWEWRLWTWRTGDPFDPAQAHAVGPAGAEAPDEAELRRLTFAETADPLVLAPALADRPVIATPEDPLSVLPGETAVAYLSTPLWCQISVGDPGRLVLDVATWRPQDTWFGPSTREGEFGYASRTNLKVDPRRIERHVARAVTPLRLVNGGADVLEVRRLRVPVPQLPLLRAADGQLWTPTVTLRRDRDELARTEVAERPPDDVGPTTAVAPARKLEPPSHIRAFNSFTRSLWS